MVERSQLLSMSYFALAPFTGSDGALRYRVEKVVDGEKDRFLATAWHTPLAFDCTPEEEKVTKQAAFSEDGLQELIAWLNTQAGRADRDGVSR